MFDIVVLLVELMLWVLYCEVVVLGVVGWMFVVMIDGWEVLFELMFDDVVFDWFVEVWGGRMFVVMVMLFDIVDFWVVVVG